MLRITMLCLFPFIALLGSAICEYNLTIVHITDFHSHWFEFNENEKKCSDEESQAGKCFGGFPRLVTLVNDIRSKGKNVIVLSSGEFFLGKSLNALHGWKLANALLPLLDIDAMSLANHDFGSGMFQLSAFLYGLKFPVLCANMWAKETSFMYSRVNKSAVLDIGEEKIGIIGYLHPETLEKSKKAVSVKFYPEIPAIEEEVMRLEGDGINKIIALGHSGYKTDLEIASTVKGVDIVIGGNSDIVLEEESENPRASAAGNIHANYPRVHHQEKNDETEQRTKNKTLVLHIPPHGKYVGRIQVIFDDDGRIVRESGDTILLDSSIEQDKDTLSFLQNASKALEQLAEHSHLPDDREILAEATANFESRRCRVEECSLGNLATDAMLQVYKNRENKASDTGESENWDDVDAVVYNSGAIRYPLLAGPITIKDLLHSLFVGDFMTRVRLSGGQLQKLLEHSVKAYDSQGVDTPGSFLQLSGLRVTYDLDQTPGNRVRTLVVLCRHCNDSYEDVKQDKTYIVAMPEFIAEGGDGYPKSKEKNPDDFGRLEIVLLIDYLRSMGKVSPELDGRITFFSKLVQSTVPRESSELNFTSLIQPDSTTQSMKNVNIINTKYGRKVDEQFLYKSNAPNADLMERNSTNDTAIFGIHFSAENTRFNIVNATYAAERTENNSRRDVIPSVNHRDVSIVFDEKIHNENKREISSIEPISFTGKNVNYKSSLSNELKFYSTSQNQSTGSLSRENETDLNSTFIGNNHSFSTFDEFLPENQAFTEIFIVKQEGNKSELKEQNSEKTYSSSESHSLKHSNTKKHVLPSATKENSVSVSESMNSSFNISQRILIDAILAEANVSNFLTNMDDVESLRGSLKLTLRNFLERKTEVTNLNPSEITTLTSNITTKDKLLGTIFSPGAAQRQGLGNESEAKSSSSVLEEVTMASYRSSGKVVRLTPSVEVQARSEVHEDLVTNKSSKFDAVTTTNDEKSQAPYTKETEDFHDLLVNSILSSVLGQLETKLSNNTAMPDLFNLHKNTTKGKVESENETEDKILNLVQTRTNLPPISKSAESTQSNVIGEKKGIENLISNVSTTGSKRGGIF